MSFIHNKEIKKLITRGENIDFCVTFKIGDTVDSETVSLLFDSVLNESTDLLQKSDIFCFAENDLGEKLPCYLTFSKEKALWVFRGVCFENSIINRCGGFYYVPQTIGEYCVEKFNSAYIKAISRMYKENKDTSGGDIDDVINSNALITAGYLISIYGDSVLKIFEEKGPELCKEELYSSVLELLKHKDDIYEGESPAYKNLYKRGVFNVI